MLGDAEEEVTGDLLAALQADHVPLERPYLHARDEGDVPLRERLEECGRGVGRRRDRPCEGQHERDLAAVAEPPADEAVVQQERAFARRRRALVWRATDTDHG